MWIKYQGKRINLDHVAFINPKYGDDRTLQIKFSVQKGDGMMNFIDFIFSTKEEMETFLTQIDIITCPADMAICIKELREKLKALPPST